MFWDYSLDNFSKRHFGTDISSPGHFCTCMFWPCRLTGTWTFWNKDFSVWGWFGTKNFWHYGCFSMEYFGNWTFWHMDILAPCKSNMDVSAQTFWHLCYCTQMSMCQKVFVPNRQRRRNVHVPEQLQGRNVHLPKCPGNEISVPKCLKPKC